MWLISLTGYLMGELWKAVKEVVYVMVAITILMSGWALGNALVVIAGGMLLLATIGAAGSDRGLNDTTYIIDGRRVRARRFLKDGKKDKVQKVRKG